MGNVIDLRDKLLDKLLTESTNKALGKKFSLNRLELLDDKVKRITEIEMKRAGNND